MLSRIGKNYEAVVSGVANTAIFVELENTVEGIIPLSEMKSDYFIYYKELYCVIGERTKQRINLGDVVRVKVRDVDAEHARVEFMLLGSFRRKRAGEEKEGRWQKKWQQASKPSQQTKKQGMIFS